LCCGDRAAGLAAVTALPPPHFGAVVAQIFAAIVGRSSSVERVSASLMPAWCNLVHSGRPDDTDNIRVCSSSVHWVLGLPKSFGARADLLVLVNGHVSGQQSNS